MSLYSQLRRHQTIRMNSKTPKLSSIKDWAEEDRPREKMIAKGSEVLTDAELVAILLGSGSRNESAVSLAKRLLAESGGVDQLGKKPKDFYTTFKGIGDAKAIALMAALELGRRRKGLGKKERYAIRNSQDAYDFIGPLIQDLSHEEFWVVYLNTRAQVISKDRIGIGGVRSVVVDPKIVYKGALVQLASSIIVYHNHPSGDVRPGKEDILLTEKLKSAGEFLDIRLNDHLIIGEGAYYSFSDEGLI